MALSTSLPADGLPAAADRHPASPRDVPWHAADAPTHATELAGLRAEIAQLRATLALTRHLVSEAERLGQTGSWHFEPATGRLTWSDGAYRIFAVDPAEGMTVARAASFYPADRRSVILDLITRPDAGTGMCETTQPFTAANGRAGWARSLGLPAIDADGVRHVCGFVRDVTLEVTAAHQLRDLADRDLLTDMWNRRAFREHLGHAVAESHMVDGIALAVLDMDNFKDVNDIHGHVIGDTLLREVARRITMAVRPDDTLARLGGDEFALILPGLGDEATARRRLAPLLDLFDAPVETAAGPIQIGASIGVALHPSGGASPDELLKSADIAMYQAKAAGRGRLCVFQPEQARLVEDRLGLLADVRAALSAGELDVFYQPIVDLRTGRMRALEALVRWRHPARGVLSPGAFMPALLDPVLSVEIGDFVLGRGLAQLRAWLDAGVPVPSLNVNLSEGQLKLGERLVRRVAALLRQFVLEPRRLKLELLESAFLGRQAEAIAQTVRQLRGIGVIVALDDFGTGYASLTHVKQFDIRHLKIDRSFIKDICDDPSDAAITRAIIDLGRNLGILVTAEGIELPEQLALLRAADCDRGQGYLFSPPMPAEHVPAFLKRWYGGMSRALLGVTPAAVPVDGDGG